VLPVAFQPFYKTVGETLAGWAGKVGLQPSAAVQEMWRAYTSLGFLEYSFIETSEAMHGYYVIRALGGLLFLAGALIMAFNLWMTVRSSEFAQTSATRTRLVPAE
jgi:cbb3-type cytochrome oxidase subunit 1